MILKLIFGLNFMLISVMALQASEIHVGGDYQLDQTPFQKNKKLGTEYDTLQKKFYEGPLKISEHRRRIEVLNELLKENPKWKDGYWLIAADTFFMSADLAYRKNYKKAVSVIDEGLAALKSCLAIDSSQLLCRFFNAALVAKKASIQGIFSSLKYGKTVQGQWLEVISKGQNIRFQPNVTLLGSAHYGLGLFYRLVPDFFLMEWFWDIRGSLEKSIDHHRKALSYDPENPCANLMLAVSLFCKADGDKAKAEYKEAMTLLDRVAQAPAIDIAQRVCRLDAPTIRANPDRTCGYTQAKYHEEKSEKELKRQGKSANP